MSHNDWPRFDRENHPVGRTVRALVWRIALTILTPIAWLSFVLLFFAFWAHALTLSQEIVVGVVSILGLLAALTVIWVSFGVQMARRWADW